MLGLKLCPPVQLVDSVAYTSGVAHADFDISPAGTLLYVRGTGATDWGPGRNWETAIAKEVPAYVDGRFRTIADRRGRALVGLSAGGYGAVLVALHHLSDFSAVESWSFAPIR